MPDAKQIELHRQLRTARDKYAYFLLAAAASATALALNRTAGSALTPSMAVLGVAVFCWGMSFFCGCRCLRLEHSNIFANFELLRVQRGEHPEAGTHPQVIAAATTGVTSAMESNSESSGSSARWQFRLLVGGALFYIAWHVLEMAQRAPSPG